MAVGWLNVAKVPVPSRPPSTDSALPTKVETAPVETIIFLIFPATKSVTRANVLSDDISTARGFPNRANNPTPLTVPEEIVLPAKNDTE